MNDHPVIVDVEAHVAADAVIVNVTVAAAATDARVVVPAGDFVSQLLSPCSLSMPPPRGVCVCLCERSFRSSVIQEMSAFVGWFLRHMMGQQKGSGRTTGEI